jgi:2-oxoglutarate ferredoxin oxidoreductase subunit alpha
MDAHLVPLSVLMAVLLFIERGRNRDMSEQKDYILLKGNEAIAKAAYRYGYDGFFGYPITPQSEILETLALDKPWETTGMVVLQAESELASINMVYAGGASGKCVMTSSSSPGVALMQEGLSYMAACEIPGLVVSVGRGGPGLGTIQPGQADYYQSVYGGGNGDYHCLVLAPASVQEMSDFMGLAKELMFKWRMPLIILSDGIIGQMMEKVVLPDYQPRRTDEEIREQCPWATNGLGLKSRKYNFMSSLELDAPAMYERNKKMTEKYNKICETEVRYEDYKTEDAEYVMVAYGCSARISMNAVDRLRAEGIKAGLLRPITLWPFPNKRIQELASQCKGMLVVELSEGQMVNDVRLAVEGRTQVGLLGRSGGVILSPDEVYEAMKGMM